jgi:hypothetical protein
MQRMDRGWLTGRLLALGFLVLLPACGGESDVVPATTTTTTTDVNTTTW